jgi:hypothetical protein
VRRYTRSAASPDRNVQDLLRLRIVRAAPRLDRPYELHFIDPTATRHAETCHGCQAFLGRIAPIAAEVADWGGRLSLVVPELAEDDGAWLSEAPPGTRVLSDPERTVARHLGLTGAAVVIADEWGEIYFAAQSGTGHQLPLPEEIVSWVRFIAIQCPECEQPEGEWRTLD